MPESRYQIPSRIEDLHLGHFSDHLINSFKSVMEEGAKNQTELSNKFIQILKKTTSYEKGPLIQFDFVGNEPYKDINRKLKILPRMTPDELVQLLYMVYLDLHWRPAQIERSPNCLIAHGIIAPVREPVIALEANNKINIGSKPLDSKRLADKDQGIAPGAKIGSSFGRILFYEQQQHLLERLIFKSDRDWSFKLPFTFKVHGDSSKIKGELSVKYSHTEIVDSRFEYNLKILSKSEDQNLDNVLSFFKEHIIGSPDLAAYLNPDRSYLRSLLLSQYNPNGLLIPDNPLFQRLDDIFFQNHAEVIKETPLKEKHSKKSVKKQKSDEFYYFASKGIIVKFDSDFKEASSLSRDDLNELFGVKGFKVILALLWMAQISRNQVLNFTIGEMTQLLILSFSNYGGQEWPPFIEKFLDIIQYCTFGEHRFIKHGGMEKTQELKRGRAKGGKFPTKKTHYSIILNGYLLDFSKSYPIGAGILKLDPNDEKLQIKILYKLAQKSNADWNNFEISVREILQYTGRSQDEPIEQVENALDFLVNTYFVHHWYRTSNSGTAKGKGKNENDVKDRPSDYKRAKKYDSMILITPIRQICEIGPISLDMIENVSRLPLEIPQYLIFGYRYCISDHRILLNPELSNYPVRDRLSETEEFLQKLVNKSLSESARKAIQKVGVKRMAEFLIRYSSFLNCPVFDLSTFDDAFAEYGLSRSYALEISSEYGSNHPYQKNLAWLYQAFGEIFHNEWAKPEFIPLPLKKF